MSLRALIAGVIALGSLALAPQVDAQSVDVINGFYGGCRLAQSSLDEPIAVYDSLDGGVVIADARPLALHPTWSDLRGRSLVQGPQRLGGWVQVMVLDGGSLNGSPVGFTEGRHFDCHFNGGF